VRPEELGLKLEIEWTIVKVSDLIAGCTEHVLDSYQGVSHVVALHGSSRKPGRDPEQARRHGPRRLHTAPIEVGVQGPLVGEAVEHDRGRRLVPSSERIDILSDYAVLGLLLLHLRLWSAGAVLVLVAVTHLAPSVIGMSRESLSDYRARDRDVVEEVSLGPAAETGASSVWREEEHALRVDGSFFEVVAGHARQYMVELKQPSLQPSFGQWWGYLSMFLLGLYLGKRRVLTEYRKHRALARQAATAGLLLGGVVMTHATWEHLGGAT